MSNDEGAKTVSRRQIARLIGGSTLAMYVLSEEDIVVFANDAAEKWLGLSNDSIVGLNCRFLASESRGSEEPMPIQTKLAAPVSWDRRHIVISPDSDGQHVRYWIPLDGDADSRPDHIAVVLCIVSEESIAKAFQRFDPNGLAIQHAIASQTGAPLLRDLWFLTGKSLSIEATRKQVFAAAQSSCSLIIQGIGGSEREQIAKAVHRSRINEVSSFHTPSLVCIECRLMDSQLLETMFEVIDETVERYGEKATLLLAGLDLLDVELLLSLDRYLSRNAKLTTIATMERSPFEAAIESESWRRLQYRLGHQFVLLPPLATRREDIETLMNAWFQQRQRALERQLRSTSDTVRSQYAVEEGFLDALLGYPWLGDHQEFDQVLEHVFRKSDDGIFHREHLPISVRTAASHVNRTEAWEAIDLDRVLESVERKLTLDTLEKCKGNRSAAAKLLNVSRARLIRRLQAWGIASEASEPPPDDLPEFEEIE